MQARAAGAATCVSWRRGWTLAILLAVAPTALAGPAEEARQIAALAGFHGGLVLHVGCGDGQLTAALRLADNCVVQGLELDANRVEAARAAVGASGQYGPVSVLSWSGNRLPYVDNLASLVVCEDAGAAAAEELMRVLRPHGALVVKRDGAWTVSVKPSLPGTDEFLHRRRHFPVCTRASLRPSRAPATDVRPLWREWIPRGEPGGGQRDEHRRFQERHLCLMPFTLSGMALAAGEPGRLRRNPRH